MKQHVPRNWIKATIFTLCILTIIFVTLTFFKSDKSTLKYTIPNNVRMEAFFVKPDKGPDISHLPDLESLRWPMRNYPSSPDLETIYNQLPFEPQVSQEQLRVFFKLLDTFSLIMLKQKLADKWFMHGGTLLGSIRHHDLIPWDDDMDVATDIKYRDIIHTEFKKLAPEILFYAQYGRDKMYIQLINDTKDDQYGSRKIPDYFYGWPSLDICYYNLTDNYINEITKAGGRYYSYNKENTFPLIYRPFGSSWYPAPSHALAFLNDMYSLNKNCLSTEWSHAYEKHKSFIELPCNDLIRRYAFVERISVEVKTPNSFPEYVWSTEVLFQNSELTDKTDFIHVIPVIMHKADIEHWKNYMVKSGYYFIDI